MKSNIKNGVLYVFILLFVLIAGCYGLGVFVFSYVFPFRTYIDNKKVSFMMPQDVVMKQLVKTRTDGLTFLLRNDVKVHVLFSDLGIYRASDLTPMSFPLKPLQWPVSLFCDTKYMIDDTLDWDVDVLSDALKRLDFMSDDYAVTPQDAYVKLQPDGSFEVVPEVIGTTIDFDRLFNAVCDVVSKGERVVDVDGLGCYEKPKVTHDNQDLIALCDDSNKILSCNIKIDLGHGCIEILPESVIRACIGQKKGKVVLDYDIIKSFVEKLSAKYNTIGTTRKFWTSNKNKISIPSGSGDTFYGWELNQEETMAAICKLLVKGKSGFVDAVWVSKGFSHDSDDNDFGDTYIEISIQDQHMWMYIDGVLECDTDVTTGTDQPSTRTPTGMFHTMDFNTEYTMHGSYGTAFSHYFIRVTPSGVGIHDSSWRSKYGGTEYIRNGSHGCINTPYDKVDFMFWRLKEYNNGANIPVIIY